ncbi:hypothetical protein [Paenibacillus odorifer]|uniref:hypothetical protein n=1 Tax=Paenibacillus odorifer TaxID=189426 RepID=UPI002116C63D|nr:hypothetical protein [Paenibacillus odorifer]
MTLLEIPSVTEKVTISGFTEVNQDKYRNKPFLEENEFLVNYGMGIVQFNPIHEGKTFVFSYYGRGLILIPSSRVYAMIDRNPDVVVTLQDYIDQIEARINENKVIISQIEILTAEANIAIHNSILATDNANQAAEKAENATVLALDAYNTTKLVFKEPVPTLQNIYTTYPNPSVGWTVQTYKDGKRYRYDGSHWIEIDIFGSNLQVVNEYKDGLMSIAEHLKLKSFPIELKERVIAFSLPDAIQGIIDNFIVFPFKGEIKELSGYCATSGEMVTTLSLERTRDLKNWSEITDRRLQFEANQNFDDKKVTFRNINVEKGDIFRINLTQQGLGINNLTITLKIVT